MKHLLFVIFAATLAACNTTESKEAGKDNGATENKTEAAMKDSASFTTIQWIDSTTQNLGSINKGAVVELTWKFKNVGDKPLIIENVLPTCGCTIADKPKEPIAVGDEGIIKAKYNSEGGSGHVSKQMTVLANIKNHNSGGETRLGFTAEVKE
jgi:predicted small secreted protein